MKHLLWALAVAIAIVPVVNDLCALDCGVARPQCPLHQRVPEPCRHDHTVGRAGLPPTHVAAARPADVAVAVDAYRRDLAHVFTAVLRVESRSMQPPRPSRPAVLRI